jgi:putative ABC transport system substrate-binding protein
MKRREFIAATAALLVSPRVLRAQGTPRRIGCFGISLEHAPIILSAWRSGLRERGWIEGKNLLVEYRLYRTHRSLSSFGRRVDSLSPDLVVAAVALKLATATIPIVFVAVFDPVALGLVQSMSRPGGNMTGLAIYAP